MHLYFITAAKYRTKVLSGSIVFTLLGAEVNSIRKMITDGPDRTSIAVLSSVSCVSIACMITIIVTVRKRIDAERTADVQVRGWWLLMLVLSCDAVF